MKTEMNEIKEEIKTVNRKFTILRSGSKNWN
jgi:hypothetical protein